MTHDIQAPAVSKPGRLARLRRRFAKDQSGVSAVEFAMLAPIFCMLMAGTVDIGSELYSRFGLNAAVAAGSNYAIVNAANVTSGTAASLAGNISKLVTSSQAANFADVTVVVNNGATSQTQSNTTTNSGAAANADQCFCPSVVEGVMTWGASVTCGGACTGGGAAGKFILITASKTHTPFIESFSFSQGGTITARALVQAQ